MGLITHPNPLLKEILPEFNFSTPPDDPNSIATQLLTDMYEHNGIGLAANQLGLPYRVFVMRGHPESFACFNPRIVNYSDEIVEMDEACLSLPGVNAKVKRPESIRVRFQTPSSETVTMDFNGMTARVFQHEIDHLNGLLFIDRLNRIKRDKAMKGYYNV